MTYLKKCSRTGHHLKHCIQTRLQNKPWYQKTLLLLLNLAHQHEKETKAMVKPSFASGAYETPYFEEAIRSLK